MRLRCGYEVIINNNIHPYVFAAALQDLTERGRGKIRNIMIIGPPNCGKTFLLAPLQIVFKTFSNPENDKYAWIGVEKSECIFLDDCRWSGELNNLERVFTSFRRTRRALSPKAQYNKDLCVKHDLSIFATGKEKISYVGRYQNTDDLETEMTSRRWKYFEFKKQIPEAEQKDIQPCGICFANLALLGKTYSKPIKSTNTKPSLF